MNLYRPLPQAFTQGVPRYASDTIWKITQDSKNQYWAVPMDSSGTALSSPISLPEKVITQSFHAVYQGLDGKVVLSAEEADLLLTWYKLSDRGEKSNYPLGADVVGEENYFSPDLKQISEKDLQIQSVTEENNEDISAQEIASVSPVLQEDGDNLEQSIRQQFKLLFEKLATEERAEAYNELHALIKKDLPYTWKQKYMFSEFGLLFRKESQHELALLCHQKALEISPDDENILFNVGRAEFELGNIKKAKVFLEKAIQIAPDFQAAYNFLSFLNLK